jgi:putative transposase
MPNYCRYFVAGGTYFFTVVTAERHPLFACDKARALLGQVFREEQDRRPFRMVASVLLPDHFHVIWSLPRGDSNYTQRWSAIKGLFTHRWLEQGGKEQHVSRGKRNECRRGVWQARYMEHCIRDEVDLAAHVDYIHYNPVKHGWAKSPGEWAWSSFARYVRANYYEAGWGAAHAVPPPTTLGVDAAMLE